MPFWIVAYHERATTPSILFRERKAGARGRPFLACFYPSKVQQIQAISSRQTAGTFLKLKNGFRGGFLPTMERNAVLRSEEHTSELQSQFHLVCRLLLE